MSHDLRPGEVALPFDPGTRADATLAFVGRIHSPWGPGNCPKNLRIARASGQGARIELDPAYAEGLTGLSVGQAIVLLYWLDQTRRDLILQRPGHVDGPRGTFALRSPVRPNPIGLCTVRITSLEAPVIGIDAIDCFDNTPLLDLKPWIETVDAPPDA